MKKLVFIVLMLMGNLLFAHQFDLSTIVISKTKKGQIVLQINSALTAFEGEIDYRNSKNAYNSPDEFKDLVVNHFRNTFSFIVNGKTKLSFKNPIVILGHETKLVAEIIGVPEKINSIYIKSDLFKDVHGNQSLIIFAVEGFPTSKIVLNNDNNHEVNLSFKNGKWKDLTEEKGGSNLKYFVLFFISIFTGIFIYIKKHKNK